MLLSLYTSLIFYQGFISTEELRWNESNVYQGVVYQQAPFFHQDDYGSFTGIIPILFEIGRVKCTPNQSHHLLNINIDLETRLNSFTVMSNLSIPHGEGILKNLTTPKKVMWGPFDYHVGAINRNIFNERNLEVFDILKSREIVVVMSRRHIWLPNKLLRGIVNSNMILVACVVLSFIAGLLFWVFELPSNPNCKPKTGAGSGIYWSFVTMTTVGYGDVTPVTLFGRFLSVVWMFIGLMIASILTATLSDTVSGTAGLEIAGKTVSVLRASHQAFSAVFEYQAKSYIEFDTYEEVVEAVRQEKVFAALLPSDIAAWMNNQILDETKDNVLSMVYMLPGITIFNIFLSKDAFPESKVLLDCMFGTLRKSVLETAQDFFRRPINLQTSYYAENSLSQLMRTTYMYAMFSMIGGLVIIGVIWAYWNHTAQRKSKVDEVKETRELEAKIDGSIKELANLIDKLNQIKNGRPQNGMNDRKAPTKFQDKGFIY